MQSNPILEWVGRVKKNAHTHAAILMIVVLCVFYRDVVFFGRTFLMLGQAPGTMPNPALDTCYANPYEYPGPLFDLHQMQTPDSGALAWFVEPYEFHSRECFRRGELPLWNPYQSMGQSHVGSGASGVFDPLCLPVYLAPRALYAWAYDLELLIRLFICGFFTYLFARRLEISWWPACLAGVAFMLTNYEIDWVGNHPSSKVFELMPVLFYGLERLRASITLRNAMICAGVVVWLVFADFSEAVFVALQCAGLYLLFRAIADIWNAENRSREMLRQTGIIFLAFVPGLLMSAPVVFPQIENVLLSTGDYHGVDAGSGTMSYGCASFILAIIPYYLGPTGVGYSPHFHVVVMLVALMSIFSVRRMAANRVVYAFFVVYFVVFVAKVFGVWGTAWIGHLPVYRQVQLCRYLVATLEFALAVLAAIGLEHVLTRKLGIHAIFGGSLILGAAFGVALYCQFAQLGAPLPSWDPSVFFKQLTKLIVIGSIFLGFLLASDWFCWPRSVTALGSIACLVIELVVWHKSVVRPLRWDPYTPPPFVQYVKEQPPMFRIFATHNILAPNTFMGYDLEDIRQCTAVESIRRRKFLKGLILPSFAESRMMGTEPVQRNQFFDLLNTKYILTLDNQTNNPAASSEFLKLDPAANAPQKYELVYDKEIRIFRNNNAFPRAFVVHAIEQVGSLDDVLRRMVKPDFNAARMAVIDGPDIPQNAALRMPANDWPMPSAAEVTRHSTNSVTVTTQLDKPGLLVLSDSYFPGWHAYVDGKEAPIYPTDVMLRGVYLEAGNHTVEFVYWPQSFAYGLYLAASVIAAFIAFAVWDRKQRNELPPIPAPS